MSAIGRHSFKNLPFVVLIFCMLCQINHILFWGCTVSIIFQQMANQLCSVYPVLIVCSQTRPCMRNDAPSVRLVEIKDARNKKFRLIENLKSILNLSAEDWIIFYVMDSSIVNVIFSAQSADYHNSVSFSNTLDLNKKRMSDRNGPIYFVCFLLGLKQFCHKNIYVFIKYLKMWCNF